MVLTRVDKQAIEEERRLFYVACSQTKDELIMTMPPLFPPIMAFYPIPAGSWLRLRKRNLIIN